VHDSLLIIVIALNTVPIIKQISTWHAITISLSHDREVLFQIFVQGISLSVNVENCSVIK
jgi:hypothetical protein